MPKKRDLIRFLPGEKWKQIILKNGASTKYYAISDHGRIISYKTKMEEGILLRPRLTQGYPSVTIGREANRQNHYLHRLVAEYFLKKPSSSHSFVIHLDYKKSNNKARNLKWVTHAMQIEHALQDPKVRLRQNPNEGPKLNISKVRAIKKALKAKNQPTLKALAKQFKVSDMQIHRIKTGENWRHVVV